MGPEQLAVGVHRTDDEAAAVDRKDHPVHDGTLGSDPHGGHAAGIHLDVVDAAGLGGDLGPLLDHRPPPVERHVGLRRERGAPALVQALHQIGFRGHCLFRLHDLVLVFGHHGARLRLRAATAR